MIGLDDGVLAYESLRGLIVAAAYSVSAEKPRAVQPARKPADVLKYAREVMIGPASEGSFIFSIHAPVPPRLTTGQGSLFENDSLEESEALEPFERRVSIRLHQAINAAFSAADAALSSTDSLEAFTGGIKRGISANLCEALVGLGGEQGHAFEISHRLAPARPTKTTLPPVRFRRDHLTVLSAAAQELRERLPEEDVLVTGNVVRLHREASESGEVSIAGVVEGEDRLRRIWINLHPEAYVAAADAHKKTLTVTIRGDLVRRGNRSYLLNAHGFEVSDNEEDA